MALAVGTFVNRNCNEEPITVTRVDGAGRGNHRVRPNQEDQKHGLIRVISLCATITQSEYGFHSMASMRKKPTLLRSRDNSKIGFTVPERAKRKRILQVIQMSRMLKNCPYNPVSKSYHSFHSESTDKPKCNCKIT